MVCEVIVFNSQKEIEDIMIVDFDLKKDKDEIDFYNLPMKRNDEFYIFQNEIKTIILKQADTSSRMNEAVMTQFKRVLHDLKNISQKYKKYLDKE